MHQMCLAVHEVTLETSAWLNIVYRMLTETAAVSLGTSHVTTDN